MTSKKEDKNLSRLTKEESETSVCYNEKDPQAMVYTCRPAMMKEKYPKEVKLIRQGEMAGKVVDLTYEVPKAWIKVSPPRQVSEKQREAGRERMKQIRGHLHP